MSQLLEEILSKENMTLAYKRVKANKGASGVDGLGLHLISKEILAKRGLLCCLDYYLN